jgi:hypothetical protein
MLFLTVFIIPPLCLLTLLFPLFVRVRHLTLTAGEVDVPTPMSAARPSRDAASASAGDDGDEDDDGVTAAVGTGSSSSDQEVSTASGRGKTGAPAAVSVSRSMLDKLSAMMRLMFDYLKIIRDGSESLCDEVFSSFDLSACITPCIVDVPVNFSVRGHFCVCACACACVLRGSSQVFASLLRTFDRSIITTHKVRDIT